MTLLAGPPLQQTSLLVQSGLRVQASLLKQAGLLVGAASTVPTNRIRNSANTGYVRSLSGGYATMGAPVYV